MAGAVLLGAAVHAFTVPRTPPAEPVAVRASKHAPAKPAFIDHEVLTPGLDDPIAVAWRHWYEQRIAMKYRTENK
jgi:hypothetical protein